MDDVMLQIDDIKALLFIIVIGIARPVGFFTSFTLFSALIRRGALVRMSASMAIGIPVMVANIPQLTEIFAGNLLDRAFLPVKETLVGLVIGMIASLPFIAFKFAGHLCDSYRGESNNNLRFDTSESITTGSMIMFLVLSMTFLADDGLRYLFGAFYGSYMIWPIDAFLPPLRANAAGLVIDQLMATFMLMLRVGLPLMLLIFLVEILVTIAGRVGRRFGLNSYTLLGKNLVFIAVLPTYVIYLMRVAGDVEGDIIDAPRILGLVFQ